MKLKMPFVTAVLWAVSLFFCIAVLTALPALAQVDGRSGLSPTVMAQIAALQKEKAARTPVQKKLSSQLVYAVKNNRNQTIAQGVANMRTNVSVSGNGRALVDMKATVSPTLLSLITKAGGTVVSSHARYKAIRAWLPLTAMESLAGRGDVQYIRPADVAMTSGGNSNTQSTNRNISQPPSWLKTLMSIRRQDKQISFAGQTGNQTSRMATLVASGGKATGAIDDVVRSPRRGIGLDDLITNTGSVTSEGDAAHAAAAARTIFNVDGTGVKVGVLSDSVDFLAASQSSGDLPANVTVLPGQAGTGAGEGTAMLEIVHDIAPGAQLFFATGEGGPAQMAQNILDLRTAGCDIIIDDLSYTIDDGPFQDGIVAQAVNTVSASGALYFSSAANSGNKNDGTSGTYEGDFVNGGAATGVLAGAGTVHDFGGGTTFDTATKDGSGVILFWADPLGGSSNDYDLYVLNPAGTAINAASTDSQTGTQDPVEGISLIFTGERIVVVKSSGADRFFHIDTLRGRLSISTEGSTRGHNASGAANAFSVAATDATNSAPAAFSGGATNPVETFSSDGPRRIFFDASGTAITPGNFTSTGGQVLQKPDITAADGVKTTLPANSGLNPFYGTSAAAPHAGALAALLKQFNPSLTPAQMRNILQSTALDIEAAGVDRDSGFGIIMANRFLYHININDVVVTEGNTGTTNATFTVTLSAVNTQAVTVNFATADGTATAPADYTASSGTVTFAPGEVSKTITVLVNGDTANEANETFFVNLTAPTNAAIVDAQGQATITNDDGAIPSLNIADAPAANEGSATTPGSATFTVTLSAASAQTVTVSFATADSTATAPADYTAANGTLTFAPGETSKTITVNFVGDAVVESDETFVVNLSAPTNATLATAQGTGTITNDDGTAIPDLSINDVAVTEGNTGTVDAMFTVTLSAAATQMVTVDFATADGTAKAPVDYTAKTGTVTFAPGEVSKTITVLVNGDTVFETTETFFVNLTAPTNAAIADAQGRGRIINDEAAPVPDIRINDVAVSEGSAGTVDAMFTVTLSVATSKTVTVKYATADGTATAPADYQAVSGTLTFAPGEASKTIPVAVKGDTVFEGNETFFVNLTAPTNAVILGGQGQGTIIEDESVPLLSINDVTVKEGNSGTVNAKFTIKLSTVSAQTVTVNAIPFNGSARAPGDYTGGGVTLKFAPGETVKTFTVPVIGDVLDEENEVFYVLLSSPVNAGIAGGRGRGIGTINDDDLTPSITIEPVSIGEGNNGVRTAVFYLRLSAPSGRLVKVHYNTSNGTALDDDDDYVKVTDNEAAFTLGQTVAIARVFINGDVKNEADETFYVNLFSPTAANLANKKALGVILNDDRPPAVTVHDIEITEGNFGKVTSMLFTVTLSAASGQAVTINYATASGTARSDNDFINTVGTLRFAPGETSRLIAVPVIGDDQVEADETLFLLMSGSTNSSIGHARAVGTIINDDASG